MNFVKEVARALHERSPRYEIVVGPDLACVVDDASAALGHDPSIYQRSGELVRIVRVAETESDAANVIGTPQVRTVPPSTLKERLTGVARWMRRKPSKDDDAELIPTLPSDDVVGALGQRGQWSTVRPLIGVLETPAMRPDGSILQEPGYDPDTGYVLELGGVHFERVPESPSREDAARALEALREVFADFPDSSEASKMVAIAAVLTLLARPAIDGNVPAFVFDAATPGTGKGLKADAVATITTGREPGKATFPSSDDELEKILGGYARRGVSVFAFDNVPPALAFGGAPLEKVLTCGDTVDLRILGRSEVISFKWRSVVLATGNNISFKGDTARRVLVSRMVSPLENPEDRDDFKHAPLLPWVKTNRARLVVAGLTVLRAYVAAGRPRTSVKPWGSFESWSSLVAASLVWAGGADPQLARPVEADEVNPEKSLLQRLLASFPRGVFTTKELMTMADARQDGEMFKALLHPELNDVLEEIAPSAERGDRLKRVGIAFRGWKAPRYEGEHASQAQPVVGGLGRRIMNRRG